MNRIDVRYDKKLDLIIGEIPGPVEFRILRDKVAETVDKISPRFVIWVLGRGAAQELDSEQLKYFTRDRTMELGKRPDAHTFLVADTDAEQILLRWFKAYSDGVVNPPITLHLERSLDDALEKVRRLRDETKADRA